MNCCDEKCSKDNCCYWTCAIWFVVAALLTAVGFVFGQVRGFDTGYQAGKATCPKFKVVCTFPDGSVFETGKDIKHVKTEFNDFYWEVTFVDGRRFYRLKSFPLCKCGAVCPANTKCTKCGCGPAPVEKKCKCSQCGKDCTCTVQCPDIGKKPPTVVTPPPDAHGQPAPTPGEGTKPKPDPNPAKKPSKPPVDPNCPKP